MKAEIRIGVLAVVFFFPNFVIAEEPLELGGGFGDGVHFMHPPVSSSKVVSRLNKNSITYEFEITEDGEGVVRKILPDSSIEDIFYLGMGRDFADFDVKGAYLVDLFEHEGNCSILILRSQAYILLKASKVYPSTPAGKFSLDPPSVSAQLWKPIYRADLVPEGIEATAFRQNIANLMVEVWSLDTVKISQEPDFEEDPVIVDTYTFTNSDVRKDGVPFSEEVNARGFFTEAEFFEQAEGVTDAVLQSIVSDYMESGSIGVKLSNLLSSFVDQTKAQTFRDRVNSLF